MSRPYFRFNLFALLLSRPLRALCYFRVAVCTLIRSVYTSTPMRVANKLRARAARALHATRPRATPSRAARAAPRARAPRPAPAPGEHVPIPPAASTARLDPFGRRRAPAAQELPLASTAE